ncbi:MAG TPA: hypothetical protein VLH79_15530, partial [Chthonomonadales bacterium]|nr:hypothetical protein [Chthonomonadales bacterium]
GTGDGRDTAGDGNGGAPAAGRLYRGRARRGSGATGCGPARAALGRSDVLTIRGSRSWLDGRTFAVIGFR